MRWTLVLLQIALLCSTAALPFVWVHLFGGLESMPLLDRALLQMQADAALPLVQRGLLACWLTLPALWLAVAVGYFAWASIPGSGRMIALLIAGALAGVASTLAFGVSTAPLFAAPPLLGLRLVTGLDRA